jgi:DNA-binding MarR family transcriptional regulator
MRGVLRDLKLRGPQTVPQMARRRPVSRQHIQAIVNELIQAELVCLAENPRHKRSRMVQLTPAGERALQEIIEREHAVLNEIAVPLSLDELDRTAENLASLRTMMEDRAWRDTVRRVLYKDGETPDNPWIDEHDDPREPLSQPTNAQ